MFAGSGKTMMMDLFYEGCEMKQKCRAHFTEFMLDIHQRLNLCRKERDPLRRVSHMFAKDNLLLCLDEFQVTDIADAMILRRLLETLFAEGVFVVMTSNRHPRQLYERGIQRASFMPCIALIEEKLKLFNLDGGRDYRHRHAEKTNVYFRYKYGLCFSPLNEETEEQIQAAFQTFCGDATMRSLHLDVNGRSLFVADACPGAEACLLSFPELCKQFTSAREYLALANNFKALFLTDIVQFNAPNRDDARRFITLVDVLYEHRVSHLISGL